jgi:tetratricopeptide (TPR) repeat protein
MAPCSLLNAGVSYLLETLVACLSLTAVWAQNPDAECGDALPENAHYVAGQCAPAVQVHLAPGVVSAQALAHKPPKAARRELDRGLQAWRKGRNDEALQHLREAVRLDPGFVEAHIRLGAFYDDAHQPALALDHFNRALLLDPESSPATVAKAAVLMTLNRPAEAEQVARRALQLSPGLIEADYLLGAALLVQEGVTPLNSLTSLNRLTPLNRRRLAEAVEHLKIAASKLPQAQAFLAAAELRLAESQDH